jgi:1-deoxy-D-xylulose-5-phosphate synthase
VGGFGSHVFQLLSDAGALDTGALKVRSMVLPDAYIDHASPRDMYDDAGLNAEHIEAKVLELLGITQLSASL